MHRFINATLFAAACLTPCAAQAENAEIVVTATRAPSEIVRLPTQVDVIDRREIAVRQALALPEILGSQAVQSGGFGQQTSLFLRGANSNHTLALFDGVRLNDAASPAGAYDFGQDTLASLDRVEILRGPASSLYGSEAIGGVVNLIPRRGGQTGSEPFFSVARGSLDTNAFSLGAAGAIGGFEYGVSTETLDTEGYDLVPKRVATHNGDADGAQISTATLSARLQRGLAAIEVLARVRTGSVEYDTFSGGPFFDLRADDPDLSNQAQLGVWRLGGDVSFSSQGSIRVSVGQVRNDRSEIDGGVATASAQSLRDFAEFSVHFDAEGRSAVAGLAIEHNAIETTPQFAAPLAIDEAQSAAFFATQRDLSPSLTLAASARLDVNQRFGDHATWSAGLVYHSRRFRLYANAGTAFKAPSLSERFEVGFFNQGNPELAAEHSRSLEVGGDWFFGDAATFSAAIYKTQIADLIEYRFVERKNVNAGSADVAGAEFRASAALTPWADLRLAYTLTDAHNDTTGERLLRRPAHAWSGSLRLHPGGRSNLYLFWTEIGDQRDIAYADDGQFLSAYARMPGWGVGAIAATFDLSPKTQFFARVDNVTNQVYEQPAAFAGPPRSLRIGLRAGF